MKLLPVTLAAASLLFAGAALAGHCPKDAKAIDQALMSTSASDATKAQVKELRDEGMALHQAGDHRQSEAKLAEAMRLLLTN